MANLRENKSLSYLPNLVSILLGLVAVFLSWQSYRTVQELKGNQPNIILAYANPDGLFPYPYGGTDGHYVLCMQTVRLQNAGGSPTSLTGFDLVIADGYGRSVQLSSQNGQAHIIADPNLMSEISSFYAYLFPGDLQISEINFGIPHQLELPAQIEPYSAIDIQPGLRFFIGSPLWQTLNDSNADQSLLITLIYTFHFASGQNLSTPEMTCYWHE
jgi:hypothetical protein